MRVIVCKGLGIILRERVRCFPRSCRVSQDCIDKSGPARSGGVTCLDDGLVDRCMVGHSVQEEELVECQSEYFNQRELDLLEQAV